MFNKLTNLEKEISSLESGIEFRLTKDSPYYKEVMEMIGAGTLALREELGL